MLDQFIGHTRHICRFPRKYVPVGPKKIDERVFLFVVELCSYQSSPSQVAFLELDSLDANIAGVGLHP